MLKCNGKTFMNLQEAVQWLLSNNALPFQCSVPFDSDNPIQISDLINPSPAGLRIGSLILFADGKVGTVTSVDSDTFTVDPSYAQINAVGITNLEIDASGDLIVTLSDGETVNAGHIKAITGLSINASQHLIASYNDGSTTDLGAIFQGNVNISGNLTADSIIENMSGYSCSKGAETANVTRTFKYVGAVKNGNKITLAVALEIEKTADISSYLSYIEAGIFTIPTSIGQKLSPFDNDSPFGALLSKTKTLANNIDTLSLNDPSVDVLIVKGSNTVLKVYLCGINNLNNVNKYFVRFDVTFLLSDSLVS